jgi:putrescine aminotransferase
MDPIRQPYESRRATEQAYADHVNKGKVRMYRSLGLELVMGERRGSGFADAFDPQPWTDGQPPYFNCHCNGGVFNLGHRHEAVVDAVRRGLEHLDVGNHHLVSGWRAAFAERLSATTGGSLPGVVFGVSGGEAVDLAIKVARAHTGRQGVVSALGGYHGCTGLSMSAGSPEWRDPFGPTPESFTQVPYDDLPALETALRGAVPPAAVLLEAIPATLGMRIPSPGYLSGVRRLCDQYGVLLILDEVQTGLGRTGTFWFYEQEGAAPDLLVTGKGLSGGIYPITATLMSAELFGFFDEHPLAHISTAGGAELGCVAGLAMLDVVEAPGFLERVRELGTRLERELSGLPFTIRRRGMFMGLAFDDPMGGLAATKTMIEHGVFAIYAGNDPSVLQFLPPLVLTDEECDELVARVRRAFRA